MDQCSTADVSAAAQSAPIDNTSLPSRTAGFFDKARGSVAGLVATAVMAASGSAYAADCPDGQEKVEKCVPKKDDTKKKPAAAPTKCVALNTEGKLYLADDADAPKKLSDESIEAQPDGSYIITEGQVPVIPVKCLTGKREITSDERLTDIVANMKLTVDGVDAVRKAFLDKDAIFFALPGL